MKEKGKGFIAEFKAFVLRGNVMDLAVGVIIGAAFGNIVTALTDDFINPLISSIGGVEIAGKIKLPWNPELALDYGHFLSTVVNFLIMALCIFLMVKAVNKLVNLGKKQEEEKPTTKKCPFCKSEISIEATKCPHCTSDLPAEEKKEEKKA